MFHRYVWIFKKIFREIKSDEWFWKIIKTMKIPYTIIILAPF
jgi:hypothetical protein